MSPPAGRTLGLGPSAPGDVSGDHLAPRPGAGGPGELLAALQAAIDAIAAPTFVLGCDGEILYASALGRTLLDGNGDGVRRALADAARQRPDPSIWVLTPLRAGDESCGYLAVLRPPPGGAPLVTAVEAAALRWKLTRRQRDVLDLVARGLTNATIAMILQIAEPTVEFHLSAIFDKAGAENRASLVGRLLDLSIGEGG